MKMVNGVSIPRLFALGPDVSGTSSKYPVPARRTEAHHRCSNTAHSQADRELVARVQVGDKEAFNVLVQRYQHRLLTLISRYVHDQTAILDVAQETFIKAYLTLPNFRGENFYTLLHQIGLNTVKVQQSALGRRLQVK